jgi:hypothetical protein
MTQLPAHITPSIQRIVREARQDGLSVAEMLEDARLLRPGEDGS